MVKMICKVPFEYDKRKLNQGDYFDADNKFVAMLLGMGKAELVEHYESIKDMTNYKTADMTAERPTLHVKRGYKRKGNNETSPMAE